MKKIIYLVSSLVILIVIAVALYFSLYTPTYTLSGKITDVATKQPISGAKVSVGDKSARTNSAGSYEIANIEHGAKITISDPGYMTSLASTALTKNTTKNFALEPTLNRVISQTDDAEVNHEYSVDWIYMSPGDQTYWGSQDAYTSLIQKRDNLLNQNGANLVSAMANGSPVVIPSWTNPVTGKKYKNITEVPIKFVENNNGVSEPTVQLHYYQNIDGYWHYFTGVSKTELSDEITSLESQ